MNVLNIFHCQLSGTNYTSNRVLWTDFRNRDVNEITGDETAIVAGMIYPILEGYEQYDRLE